MSHQLIPAVRDFMAANGLTQLAFAQHAGLSKPTVCPFLGGLTWPKRRTVDAISEAITRPVAKAGGHA